MTAAGTEPRILETKPPGTMPFESFSLTGLPVAFVWFLRPSLVPECLLWCPQTCVTL